MKILANLFGNKESEIIGDSTYNLNELLLSLDQYIDVYEENNGLKPERILVKSNIHKLFEEACVYSSKRFGDILIIPATALKNDLNWQAI